MTANQTDAKIKPIVALGAVAYFLFWIGFIIVCINQFELKNPSTGSVIGFRLVGIFLAALALASLWLLSRLPYRTLLDDSQINTYSIRGRKTLNLNDVVKASGVLLTLGGVAGPKTAYNCMKLSDRQGKTIFLALGSISRAQRINFYEPLGNLTKKQINHYSLNYVMRNWFKFMQKQ